MQRALSGVELERDSADVTLRPQRRCDGCLLRLCDAVHFVVVVAGVGNVDIMVRLMMTIIMVNRFDIWRFFHFFCVVYCFIFHLFPISVFVHHDLRSLEIRLFLISTYDDISYIYLLLHYFDAFLSRGGFLSSDFKERNKCYFHIQRHQSRYLFLTFFSKSRIRGIGMNALQGRLLIRSLRG